MSLVLDLLGFPHHRDLSSRKRARLAGCPGAPAGNQKSNRRARSNSARPIYAGAPAARLKGVLGDAAAAAAKTSTFLGERYRRLARRRGKLKALVAIARTLLVIIWHLLADRSARYDDLGPSFYTTTINTDRKARSHIRQLEALGFTVTVARAA